MGGTPIVLLILYVPGEPGLFVVQVGDEMVEIYGDLVPGRIETVQPVRAKQVNAQYRAGDSQRFCQDDVPRIVGWAEDSAPVTQEVADAGGVLAVKGEDAGQVVGVQVVPVAVYVQGEGGVLRVQVGDDAVNVDVKVSVPVYGGGAPLAQAGDQVV